MPEIQTDGPIETPIEAANEGYLRQTNPGLGRFVLSTLGDAGTAFLGRAAERGTVAGSSSFDQGMAALTAQGGAFDQPLVSVPQSSPSPEMPPEQYNDLYAPRDTNGKVVSIGDKPMPEALAKIIGQQKAEAMQRESVLARYGETHSGITSFAVGSLASMLDPLNAGAAFLPAIGEGAVAARLGGGLLARTVGRVAAGAEMGIAQQLPLSALKYGLSPEEASDYGLRDAMRDLAYGAAGVAVLHTGIGSIGEILGRGARDRISAAALETNPALAGEPSLSAGMVRLYRGETGLPGGTVPDYVKESSEFKATLDATGRWFTASRAEAEHYNAVHGAADARLSYVDVPAADAQKFLSSAQPEAARFSAEGRAGQEYFLPRDIADSRQPLAAGERPAVSAPGVAATVEQPAPGPRVGPVSLVENIRAEFPPEAGDRHAYNILDKEGGKVGAATIVFEGKTARISDIYLGHEASDFYGDRESVNTVGPAQIRQLARAFLLSHPEIDEISGYRMSGARSLEAAVTITRRQVLGNADAAAILSADAVTKNAAMRGALGEIADGRPVDVQPIIGGNGPEAAPALARIDELTADRLAAERGERAAGSPARSFSAIAAGEQAAVERSPADFLKLDPTISHAEYVQRLSELRDNKPRPINKLWNNPDAAPPEEVAAAKERLKIWNSEYNKVSRVAKQALERDNEAFHAEQDARAAPTTATSQADLAREGWAPSVSRDELVAANDAVYGPKAETAPRSEAGADADLAAAEERAAQIPPESLHPEDQAALAASAEGVEKAGFMQKALETAASCIMGII